MKKILLLATLTFGLLALTGTALAQQSREFNDFIVHYNALRTDLLPPQVAQGYGIRRSSNRALLNVTVMAKPASFDQAEIAVPASIVVHAANLTGQRRDIALREIRDAEGAIYYVGEFPVHNLETYQFKLEVLPDGEPEPLMVEFRQQFYTE